MNNILDALDVLVVNNCLTASEALQKAYLAGYKAANKEHNKDKPELVSIVDASKTSSGRK